MYRNQFCSFVVGFAMIAVVQVSFGGELLVDIGATGQVVQAAPLYQSLTQPTTTNTYPADFAATGTDVGVTLLGVGAGLDWRNRGAVTNPLGDVARDFAFASGNDPGDGIVLRFSNLAAGNYELTAYHHDTDFAQARTDASVAGALDSDVSGALGILASTGANPASLASSFVTFEADGSTDVDVFFERLDDSVQPPGREAVVVPVLSGFALNQVAAPVVPEPTTFAMWVLLGAVGVCWCWRHGTRRGA